MNDQDNSRGGIPDFFKDGFDQEGNKAMREAEKDILGEPLPELSFDIEEAFQKCKKITDQKKRLQELGKYERELTTYFESIQKRYRYWSEHNNPLNIDLEELGQIIEKTEYAREAFRQEISACQTEAAYLQEKSEYNPDDILTLQEAAEYLGVNPNTISSAASPSRGGKLKKVGRGHYKISDLNEYFKGIPSQGSEISRVAETSSTRKEGETTSIRLRNPYKLDLAIELVKLLANDNNPKGAPLIDLEGLSPKQFTSRHFHEDGEEEKVCTYIKWTGGTKNLFFFLLELNQQEFIHFPYVPSADTDTRKRIKPLAVNHFYGYDRNLEKLTILKNSTATTNLSEAGKEYDDFKDGVLDQNSKETKMIRFLKEEIQQIVKEN
ncbi:MAG: helix-turn-helix domain-containing protein [Spirochaetota bacterium]|nr:helix-turn-helix domain-containing protein [Spirochaetota bacterium]